MKTTLSNPFSFAPITAMSVHDTRLGAWESRQQANQARRRRGVSTSYDVLALRPIAEETLRDGRQAMREEWVLCDSILSLQ